MTKSTDKSQSGSKNNKLTLDRDTVAQLEPPPLGEHVGEAYATNKSDCHPASNKRHDACDTK